LRIISLQEYLRHYWAQRKLRRLIEAEANKVHELINSWHFKKRAEANPISLETVFSWIRDCSSDVICRDLAIPAEQAKKMSECLNRFRAILEALDKSATADPFSTLVAARTVATGKTDAACRDDAIKQAKNEPLPDDVFLLPSLPQLDIGPTVVLLRDIVAIPVAMVRYTTADARTGDHFLRIGTLQPTFKYAMSQAFGNLYARIGLPEEYEKRCKLVMDDLHRLNFKV
jgi:hypothetical protein